MNDVYFKEPISSVKFPVDENMIENFSEKDKVTIISFWKKDQSARDFNCYHYFYIKNFVRLEEAANGLVFLIYKQSNSDNILAILDLENHGKEINKPLIAHDHVSTQAFEQEFKLVGEEIKKIVPNFERGQFELIRRKDQ